MTSSEPILYAAGLFVTVAILAIAHWFPWPARLHRLAAYAIGVGAILAGVAVWLIPTGQAALFWQFAAFAVAGGIITAVCWGIDWILNQMQRNRHDVTG